MKNQLTKITVSLLTLLIATSLIVFPTTVTDQTVTAQEDLIPKPPTGPTPTPFLDPSQKTAAKEKATNIIQNVMSVDLSKYDLYLQQISLMDGTPLTNDNRQIIDISYLLIPKEGNSNENNQIQIAFSIEKDVITNYFILPAASQVITTTPC